MNCSSSSLLHQSPSFYNYCLWPYSPSRPTKQDDQPALTILLESFRCCGIGDFGNDLVANLLQLLGPSKTVFGIKSVDGVPSWELYFYDYNLHNRQFSSEAVIGCFSNLSLAGLRLDDCIPYIMFSLEFTLEDIDAGLSPALSVYLGNPGGTLFGGKSYCVETSSARLVYQNSYHFYDFEHHQDEISEHVESSLHVPACFDGNLPFRIYPFFACKTLCIAHKRHCDGLYFSGVPLASLLQFLTVFKTHPALSSFLSRNSSMLDYLLFDVGLDCQVRASTPSFTKTAIYASF
jgi:hypothetical protein